MMLAVYSEIPQVNGTADLTTAAIIQFVQRAAADIVITDQFLRIVGKTNIRLADAGFQCVRAADKLVQIRVPAVLMFKIISFQQC